MSAAMMGFGLIEFHIMRLYHIVGGSTGHGYSLFHFALLEKDAYHTPAAITHLSLVKSAAI